MDKFTIQVFYKGNKRDCHIIPKTLINVIALIVEDPPSPFGEKFFGKFNYTDNRWIYDTESTVVDGRGKSFKVPSLPAEIVNQILKYLSENFFPKDQIH
jgi:hypothetical protein